MLLCSAAYKRTHRYSLHAARPTARPHALTPAQSFCGNATTLDKVSFWLFDDEGRRQSYLGGAYLLTKEGTRTIRTNLTGERAATGVQSAWEKMIDGGERPRRIATGKAGRHVR